ETTRSLAERQNKTEETILEVGQTMLDVANAQARTSEILTTLAERQIATEETTLSLADRQNKMEQIILEVGQTMLEVANAQERTNAILERHIANHN
ncbi:MAG: hypothetical protein AABO57_12600, partial [Acidobacteriota bacterium]